MIFAAIECSSVDPLVSMHSGVGVRRFKDIEELKKFAIEELNIISILDIYTMFGPSYSIEYKDNGYEYTGITLLKNSVVIASTIVKDGRLTWSTN